MMGRTVLEQWSLLGEEFEFGNARHLPLFNPRHVSHSQVHFLCGKIPDLLNGELNYGDSIQKLYLHVFHILALARPNLNREDGRPADEWLLELSKRLTAVLIAEGLLLPASDQEEVMSAGQAT